MKTTLTIIIVLLSFLASAQEFTQTIKGKIIDSDTKVTLPGANIIVLGSNPLRGTSTDLDGNFRLEKIPVGRQSFKVTYVGYEEVTINEVLVGTGREVMMNIELKESVNKLAEITVHADDNKSEAINQMASVSATQITVESTSRIAAGINDPGRTAQSFAGVSSADDENNELVIRGNSPRGVLWRMEGIEVPNPNHFSNGEGGSGGGVCALSTQVLANSDFFTGAFPAEYGNAFSGVFDLSLRNGNSEKREYTLQLGFMGAQVSMEGPFKKGSEASYLFNYRNSTLKWLGKAGIIDFGKGDVAPSWQDVSYKIFLPTKKMGRFSVWGVGGISSAGTNAIRDTSEWLYRSNAFEDSETHTLGILGVTHNYLFRNNMTYLKTVAAISSTSNIITEDSLSFKLSPTELKNEDFAYNTISFSSLINHKFNAKNSIRIGGICQYKSYDFNVMDYNDEKQADETKIDEKGRTGMYETFVQWQHRINENIDFNSGVHFTTLTLNKDYTIEPRLGIKWKVNGKHTLSFGAGMHSRVEPVSLYLAEGTSTSGTIEHPNEDLKMTRAAHVVLGYNWTFANDFRLKSEVYYQYLFNVPVKPGDTTGVKSMLNFSSGFTNEKLVNKGTGRNYGAEITLEKFFSKSWYMLVTASLFESKYTMPGQKERNTMFNSKYVYNVVAGKEFKVGRHNQNILGTNMRVIWRGGYRTIPVDLEASLTNGREIRNFDMAFETKAPDYFRVDVGLSFRKNNPNWSWLISLDFQNLTNRRNVWDENYDPEIGKMVNKYMVGMVPVLNYCIEF